MKKKKGGKLENVDGISLPASWDKVRELNIITCLISISFPCPSLSLLLILLCCKKKKKTVAKSLTGQWHCPKSLRGRIWELLSLLFFANILLLTKTQVCWLLLLLLESLTKFSWPPWFYLIHWLWWVNF